MKLYRALDFLGVLLMLRDEAVLPHRFDGGDSKIGVGEVGVFFFGAPMSIGMTHSSSFSVEYNGEIEESTMTWSQCWDDGPAETYETPEYFVREKIELPRGTLRVSEEHRTSAARLGKNSLLATAERDKYLLLNREEAVLVSTLFGELSEEGEVYVDANGETGYLSLQAVATYASLLEKIAGWTGEEPKLSPLSGTEA